MPQPAKFRWICVLALAPFVLTSCGSDGPKPTNQKKTIPVKGIVTVDGEPAQGVDIELNPVTPDAANPTASTAKSGPDGSFAVTTYSTGDGAPAGEYKLTFTWTGGGIQLLGDENEGDKLNGRYSDIAKSEHPLTVTDGAPEVDAGTIALTTK